jgi:surface antigen
VKDDLTAAEKAAERAAKNTTLSKFVTNVESRIFANLSKQMVDNMFGTNCTEDDETEETECPLSGTATLPDGSTVYWAKDETTETITLTVTDANGGITQLIVPVGDFKF